MSKDRLHVLGWFFVGLFVALLIFAPLAPAGAAWNFNCRHDRHSHIHFGQGVRHIFKDIATWNKGGRHYHRGTWVTFDLGREKVTGSDRRTYDCTGAH